MVFARSRVARASDFQISRAAARPKRAREIGEVAIGLLHQQRGARDGAAARRRAFDSSSATRTPASANRYAQIAPVMPPPTMTTSTFERASMAGIVALWRGDGRAKAGDRVGGDALRLGQG